MHNLLNYMVPKRVVVRSLLIIMFGVLGCSRDPAKLVESGKKYQAEGKQREAIIQFMNALKVNPQLAEAHYFLGLSYLSEGLLAEAARQFAQAVSLRPDDLQAQAIQGNIFLLGHKFDEARTTAEFILKKDPSNLRGQILLGNSYAGIIGLNGSIGELTRVFEGEPRLLPSYLDLGSTPGFQREPDPAEEAYEKALSLLPDSLEGRLALGNFYLQSERFAEAEQKFKEAIALDPKSVDAHQGLGFFYLQTHKLDLAEQEYLELAKSGDKVQGVILAHFYVDTGKPEKAIEVLQKVIAADAQYAVAKRRLADLFIRQKDFDKAAQLIAEVLTQHPDDPEAQLTSDRILLSQGRISEALADLQKLVKARPQAPLGRLYLGMAYSASGDPQHAEAEFLAAVQNDQALSDAYIPLAELKLSSGDVDSAVRYAQHALTLNTNLVSAHLLLARTYLVRKDYKRAAEEIDEVLKRDPANAAALYHQGILELTQGNLPQAENRLEASLKSNPDEADSLALLSTIYLRQKRPDKAVERVNQAIALYPHQVDYQVILAHTFLIQGDKSKAEEAYEKAVSLDSSNVFRRIGLADFYLGVGDVQKSIDTLAAIIQSDPANVVAGVRLADIYLNRKDFAKVLPIAQEMLNRNAKSTEGLILKGRVLLAQKKTQEAIAQFQAAVQNEPASAYARYYLGTAYFEANDRLRAESEWTEAVKTAGPFFQPYLALAQIKLETGDRESAIRYAQQAVSGDPNLAEAQLLLGMASGNADAYKTASALFEDAIKKNPEDATLRQRLGTALLAEGDLMGAQTQFEEGLKRNPDSTEMIGGLIRTYLAEKRPDQAIQRLNQEISKYPRQVGFLQTLAEVYIAQKDYPRAEDSLKKAVLTDPKNVNARLGLGNFYQSTEQWDKALSTYEDTATIVPDNLGIKRTLANIYLSRRQFDRVALLVDQLLKADDKDARILKGKLLLAEGKNAESAAEFQTAVNMDPKVVGTQYLLGLAYSQDRNLRQAEAAWNATVALDAGHAPAHLGLARLKLESGDFNGAITHASEALKAGPNNPDVLLVLGNAWLMKRNFKNAISFFEKMVAELPGSAAAHERLGSAYAAAGETAKAAAQFEAALHIDPNSADVHFQLGTVYETQNSAEKAILQYREALKLAPQSPIPMNNLAWLLAQKGANLDEALELARAADKIMPDNPKILDTTGWIYHKKGSYDNAINLFKKCVEKAPSEASCHYHLGMSYLKAGSVQNAKLELNQAIKLDQSFPEAAQARSALATLR